MGRFICLEKTNANKFNIAEDFGSYRLERRGVDGDWDPSIRTTVETNHLKVADTAGY